MKLHLIAGARPNFLKISSICNSIRYLKTSSISFRLIHTGQHFDKNLSQIFFSELNIPKPDVNFNCGGGSSIEQISKIMLFYEKYIRKHTPDYTLVVGDVNSTIACSMVAKSLGVKVIHVEAGIRSNDISMPEEINRILTDSISDLAFVTSENAINNLVRSGFNKKKIFFVGNTMVDTLLSNLERFKKPLLFDENKLKRNKYFVLTLHRPSNVDNSYILYDLLNYFDKNLKNYKIIFPVHPRTKKNITKKNTFKNIILCDPLGYLEFNFLVKNSFAVITDSGGITEETTVMKIPCLTIRDNTERPETITDGTNELIGTETKNFDFYFKKLFDGNWKSGKVPKYWDGKTGDRIIKSLISIYGNR
tara:strand:- start:187 stop:1275 length:1089 start_codon:yes stop_codon:yes gene_type:complete